MNRLVFFIALSLLGGCARNSPPQSLTESAVGRPQDEVAQDLKNQGIFKGTQTSKVNSEYEVMASADEQKFYLKKGRVVSSIRNARKNERALMYWREKFKGKLYHERALRNQHAVHGHQKAWVELACDRMGTGVIFDPVHERVVKVFYYGHKK